MWGEGGGYFTYWTPESGLHVTTNPEKICPDVPPILHMKWSPRTSSIACVIAEISGKKPCLAVIDPSACTVTKLVEDFPSNEKQWAWLREGAIVYADGAELWQVDINGERTFVVSLD